MRALLASPPAPFRHEWITEGDTEAAEEEAQAPQS